MTTQGDDVLERWKPPGGTAAPVDPVAPGPAAARPGSSRRITVHRAAGDLAPRPLAERTSAVPVLLVLVDVVLAVGAALLAGLSPVWTALTVLALVAGRALTGVYRKRLQLSYVAEMPRALAGTAMAFGALAVLVLTGWEGVAEPVEIAVAWFTLLVILPRAAVFQAGRVARTRFGRCERAVVVGASGVGAELVGKMLDHPEFGLRPVGFVDRDLPPGGDPRVPYLGSDVVTAVRETRAGCVVVAFTDGADSEVVDLAIAAHRMRVSLLVVPRLYELYHDVASVERLRSYPLVRLALTPTARPSWRVKLALDRLLSGLALLALSPLLAVLAAAVLLESGRPVLFAQERVGLDGRLFRLLKFRSMRPADERESQSRWTIAGDPRVGPVGRVLRRTSLDELPQLWNVLRGDMSLVGPRPERPGFVRQFTEQHTRYWARHRVPTGLTGLAQVNGLRGDTSIADRARYDNYYIANWSLWLDLRVVLMTGRELLRRGQH